MGYIRPPTEKKIVNVTSIGSLLMSHSEVIRILNFVLGLKTSKLLRPDTRCLFEFVAPTLDIQESAHRFLQEAIKNPSIISQLVATRKSTRISLFIDTLNVLNESNKHHPQPGVPLMLDVPKMVSVVESMRKVERKAISGSSSDPIRWSDWGSSEVFLSPPSSSIGESTGGERLIHEIRSELKKPVSSPRTLVLVSGAGSQNSISGDSSLHSFPEVIQQALEIGWSVELWAWRRSLTRVYFSFQESYPDPNRFRVVFLDDCFEDFFIAPSLGSSDQPISNSSPLSPPPPSSSLLPPPPPPPPPPRSSPSSLSLPRLTDTLLEMIIRQPNIAASDLGALYQQRTQTKLRIDLKSLGIDSGAVEYLHSSFPHSVMVEAPNPNQHHLTLNINNLPRDAGPPGWRDSEHPPLIQYVLITGSLPPDFRALQAKEQTEPPKPIASSIATPSSSLFGLTDCLLEVLIETPHNLTGSNLGSNYQMKNQSNLKSELGSLGLKIGGVEFLEQYFPNSVKISKQGNVPYLNFDPSALPLDPGPPGWKEATHTPAVQRLLASFDPPPPLARVLSASTVEEFHCPITHEVMEDPVITPLGHSYERAAIEDWISLRGTCPISDTPLSLSDLRPNLALKQLISGMKSSKEQYLKRTSKAETTPLPAKKKEISEPKKKKEPSGPPPILPPPSPLMSLFTLTDIFFEILLENPNYLCHTDFSSQFKKKTGLAIKPTLKSLGLKDSMFEFFQQFFPLTVQFHVGTENKEKVMAFNPESLRVDPGPEGWKYASHSTQIQSLLDLVSPPQRTHQTERASERRRESRPPCKFGDNCTNYTLEHREQYAHAPVPCKYHPNCKDVTDAHHRIFTHAPEPPRNPSPPRATHVFPPSPSRPRASSRPRGKR